MPDLRAHGLSGKPHGAEHYPRGILARDLRELVAHLGLTEFDLGGFSLGARTTVEAVGEGLRPRRAVLGGAGLEGLRNWKRRKTFFLEAIALFDKVQRGDPHWLSIQFMKSQKIDRVAAALLLESFEDAFMDWLRGLHHADAGGLRRARTTTTVRPRSWPNVLPNAIFEEVPGTHMSSVTKPQLGEAIADFLAA